ncbi:HAMP domain-containing histidine kinase [Oceanispirochaeta crateris]|uniref:histidine kinase n=1 Tax=Oceanispirochaeta crateris TaxID=2518645 RepID=A0A5C1QLR9_9SPIO|nr:HAMP domain-containing sensor histidine kinase [Oceanispirochaeta crateris]QEN09013.1 HAMP domain-containing histidine kinase [Oceanispirochaeta crateris]
MHFQIKSLLIFFLVIAPLFSQEQNLKELGALETYADEDSFIYDLMDLPESKWYTHAKNPSREKGTHLWLKVKLNNVFHETDSYLTEHKGVGFWESFLVKDGFLVQRSRVDWTLPDSSIHKTQYRGFTYSPVTQFAREDYTLYIHIHSRYVSHYQFFLRSYENFLRKQQSWTLIQGMGMGFLMVILLLSIILIINMRYRINWLFLMLVLSSSLNTLFMTGLGPSLIGRLRTGGTPLFWYSLLGLFNPAVILFLKSFLKLSGYKKIDHCYFSILLYLSLFLSFLPLLVPSHLVFFIVNLQSLISYVFIGGGLLWLILRKRGVAQWLLYGWLLFTLVTASGYLLSRLDDSWIMAPIIFYLLGLAFLVMFFGAAMIQDMVEKRKSETSLRISAETTAMDAIEQMSENERMADLGRLVASVTHELGTPLGVGVTLSTSIVSTTKKISNLYTTGDLSEDDFNNYISDTIESSDLIFRNMEQARILINGFKQVASDQAVPDIRTINLNEYLEMLIKGLNLGIKKTGCTIEMYLSRDLMITSIPGIISQVLTNLINNALIHGLKDFPGGVITIKGLKVKNFIHLSVCDKGRGIPLHIQNHIFDVYFTTRKGAGGTGLGLAIVKSLVEEKLKGSISFESSPGAGTVFTLILPESISAS